MATVKSTVSNTLPNKIKELREGLEESQEVFGERFGVTQSAISKWEGGEIPKRTLWTKIAATAGVSEAEFFFDLQVGPQLEALRRVLVGAFQLWGRNPELAEQTVELVFEALAAQHVFPELEADRSKNKPDSSRNPL